MSTRACTNCVGQTTRAATDADPTLTLLSVDGVGAYDNITLESMLSGVAGLQGASSILPFVMLSYGDVSTYNWRMSDGTMVEIEQAEGGEQGDPLMPLLYCLGAKRALAKVAEQLNDGERLFDFFR